jgi:predicted transglutaminase-like cysteine proteinase
MKTSLRLHVCLCLFCILTTIIQLVVVESVLAGNSHQLIDQETLASAEKKYGIEAYNRLVQLQDLIRDDTSTNDMEKLRKVNRFFNQLEFVSDSLHYQKEDYWATPLEFLASGGGDCEDFSLAKYFTLKAMGVAEKKLNLTYVKAVDLNQAHMVMTYFETPDADPLVLDNLINTIKPASQRLDLLPVYSFNGTGLWLAKQRGRGKYVGRSDRLKRWQELQKRMPKGFNG